MIVLDSPISSRSGYGERGRELARALYSARDAFCVWDRAWGNTPKVSGFSPEYNVSDPFEGPVETYIYHGLPSNFQPRVPADHFVFCTAGTEVDRIGLDAIVSLNHADEIWVSSEFAKTVFEQSAYRANGQEYEVEPPIKVISEVPEVRGAETELSQDLEDRLDDPAILSVATWTDFRPGVGRKAVTELLSMHSATFGQREDSPPLVLKTDAGSLSVQARKQVREQAEQLADGVDVFVIQGDLTKEEMWSLYTSEAIKGFATLTRGEAFGRTIMEASKAGLPVLCPGYTGQLDFIDEDRQLVVGGEPTEAPVDQIRYTNYPQGSRWMAPNMPFAHQALFTLHNKSEELSEDAEELAEELQSEYTEEALADKLDNLLP